jgi:hypothetical protein
MFEGETSVVRAGKSGVRDVTYRIVYVNGKVDVRKVVRQDVLRKPVDEIVKVGTKPAAVNFAGGNSVWDRLAQCESGGNWAANTGNGYYGGIQFAIGSWQAAGGSGRPDLASRATQIAIGQRLWNQGGWVHWPACTAKLGYR